MAEEIFEEGNLFFTHLFPVKTLKTLGIRSKHKFQFPKTYNFWKQKDIQQLITKGHVFRPYINLCK